MYCRATSRRAWTCNRYHTHGTLATLEAALPAPCRWSNGKTWIEVAAAMLGQNLTNYGAGGATTGLVPARGRCGHAPSQCMHADQMHAAGAGQGGCMQHRRAMCCCAEIPPLPVGFANITVPTTVLSPTLPQQLDLHLLHTNNSLSAAPLYFLFIGGAPASP